MGLGRADESKQAQLTNLSQTTEELRKYLLEANKSQKPVRAKKKVSFDPDVKPGGVDTLRRKGMEAFLKKHRGGELSPKEELLKGMGLKVAMADDEGRINHSGGVVPTRIGVNEELSAQLKAAKTAIARGEEKPVRVKGPYPRGQRGDVAAFHSWAGNLGVGDKVTWSDARSVRRNLGRKSGHVAQYIAALAVSSNSERGV